MIPFFRRLQWRLTLSYAVVTASTVIILAGLLVAIALYFDQTNSSRVYDSYYWTKTAFQDNIPYLLDDPAALQNWLNRVREKGFTITDIQTNPVRESLDYARTLVPGSPIYVLDDELNLVAASPVSDPNDTGKPFPANGMGGINVQKILEAAQTGDRNYYAQSLTLPDGTRVAAFPLRKDSDAPVDAIVVYQLKPLTFATPSNLEIYGVFFFVTTMIMLILSLPIGAVFGWLASRGLQKRLGDLSTAAQSWSQGDFSVIPHDKSGDEVGELTRNLSRMAEQLQTHIHTRDELTRIEERNRLARDLHDTVKQQTYASRMQLSAAKNLLASSPAAAAEHLDAALQLNRETQQELKLIIDELRPAALEGRGLAQALTEYAARWQEHTGIRVETSVSGDRPLPLDVEQALYRVLQESLSNIARHAEAEAVQITLTMSPEQVTLVVADNGRGFEPAAVAPHSLGLAGMKERLAEVGGTLTVETLLTAGTRITAEVQLKS